MNETFYFLIYLGGWIGSYSIGHPWRGIIWPVFLGMTLATNFTLFTQQKAPRNEQD